MSDAASQFRDYVGLKEPGGNLAVENKSKKGGPVLTPEEDAATAVPDPDAAAAGREDAVDRADKPESGAKKATTKKAPAKKAPAKKTTAKKTAAAKKK